MGSLERCPPSDTLVAGTSVATEVLYGTLLLAALLALARLEQVASPGEYRALEHELLAQEIPSRLAITSQVGPATRDRVLFRAGFDWIRRHPAQFVVTTLRRLRHFCAPWVSRSASSAPLAVLSACWFVPLFLFGFIGLVAALSRREGGAVLVATVAAITILTVGALFHSVQRYRIPSIDLYLGLFGAAWLAERTGPLRRLGTDIRPAEAKTFDDRTASIDLTLPIHEVKHLEKVVRCIRGVFGVIDAGGQAVPR